MPYVVAFRDWVGCAYGGRNQPATRHARSLGGDSASDRVLLAGTSGHVLDFDDTYFPALTHVTAVTAPAALVAGASFGSSIGDVIAAHRAGYEVMASVAQANFPALYERGWHTTAVCGVVGAAVAVSTLCDASSAEMENAIGLALLGAGGLRAAFGSDGKSIQVGMSAAQGLTAALLAHSGAKVSESLRRDFVPFTHAYGGNWPDSAKLAPNAIDQNWVKAYPSCLQTHSSIEAGLSVRADGATGRGQGAVRVHPVSLLAASIRRPTSGLEAKFSIPYMTAISLLGGRPRVADFERLDEAALALSDNIEVIEDNRCAQSEARLTWTEGGARYSSTVVWPSGSPSNPMPESKLQEKLVDLSSPPFVKSLDDLLDTDAPAASVLDAIQLW